MKKMKLLQGMILGGFLFLNTRSSVPLERKRRV